MGIVTRVGDKGMTRTLADEEISKADERLELTGTIDELNAQVGFARSMLKMEGLLNLAAEVRGLQVALFRLASESSLGPERSFENAIGEADVKRLDDLIGQHEHDVKLPESFLIPGTTPAASAIEVARATARRLERRMASARERGQFDNGDARVWINRVSDYLFVLARAAEQRAGVEFDAAK